MRVSPIFVKLVLSHRNESFCRGIDLCSRNFEVSKNFMPIRKISLFFMKSCCLTVPKNFIGEPPCVSQNFRYREIHEKKGEEGRSISAGKTGRRNV